MAKEHARLKLGKRAPFVKTHIKQLPQDCTLRDILIE